MIKIRNLEVNGFRGIINSANLDFENGRSLVLWGYNGDGKSSFSYALEWFLKGSIAHLSSEGCGPEDYRHRELEKTKNALVSIEFTDAKLNNTKELDAFMVPTIQSKSTEFDKFLAKADKANFILHYRDVSRFVVELTKTGKKDFIANLLGLKKLTILRDDLQNAFGHIERNPSFNKLNGRIAQQKDNIAKKCGKESYSEEQVFSLCKKLADECDYADSFNSLSQLTKVVDELEKRKVPVEGTQRLNSLSSLKSQLPLVSNTISYLLSLKRLVSDYNVLIAEKKVLTADLYAKMYDAAEKILKGDKDLGNCPLCEQPYQNERLLQLIETRRAEISEIVGKLKEFDGPFSIAVDQLRIHKTRIQQIMESVKLYEDEIADLKTLKQLLPDVAAIEKNLMKHSNVEKVTVDFPGLERVDTDYKKDVSRYEDALAGVIKKESVDPKIKKYFEKKDTLKQISEFLTTLKELEKSKEVYDIQYPSMKEVFERFDELQKGVLGHFLRELSGSINEIYQALHPLEKIEDVALVIMEKIGIEFSLKYYQKEALPPTKILSESHLNSLGLSLFLASVRHLNDDIGFLVLDDVVSSMDTNHRARLAKVLGEKFADYQIVMLTHDDLWFETLMREPTTCSWKPVRIRSWDYKEGITLERKAREIREEIDQRIARSDYEPVFNFIRQWIEQVLWDSVIELRVSLPARRNKSNEQRLWNQLVRPLASHVKEQDYRPSQIALKTALKDLNFSGWFADMESHFNRFSGSTPGKGDIDAMIEYVDEFISLFVCGNCGKAVWFIESQNKKGNVHLTCECGQLQFNLPRN